MKRLLLLLLLLPGLAWGQTAEEEDRDRGILQGFLEDKLSSAGRTIRIDGFSGALSSRATLDRLTIADDEGVWLVLENAVLDWNRSAILRGRVEISELSVERLELPRLPAVDSAPSPEAQGFSLPDLPVSIDIAKLKIARAEIGAPVLGEDVALALDGSASLGSGSGATDLVVTRLDGPEGEISLDASYSNASRDLSLAASFHEGPGGIAAGLLDLQGTPAVDLNIDGDGTLDDFSATVLLTTDGITRIDGTIGFGTVQDDDGNEGGDGNDTRFGADITGDIAPLLAPEFADFFGDAVTLDVAGIIRAGGGLDLERLSLATRSLTLDGEIRLDPDGWPRIIDVEGRLAAPDGEAVLLPNPGTRTLVQSADLRVQYDAASGDAWTASAVIDGLRQAALNVGRAKLSGSGTIDRGNGTSIGRVAGALDLDITGLMPGDPALREAIGETLSGGLRFDYTGGQPLKLSDLSISGGDFGLTGAAVIGGLQSDLNLTIDGDIGLTARDLSRFAPLAGVDLSGRTDISIAGRLEPLAGIFDLTLDGTGTDLGIGQENLDPLIAGDATLSGRVVRDKLGFRIRGFSIATPATRLKIDGDLATDDSEAEFDLTIEDTSVVAEGLTGPANLAGSALQKGEDWTFELALSGPGGIAARIDAFLTMPKGTPQDVNGIAEIAIADLSPYSDLAGRDLGGSLNVTLAGKGNIPDRSFEASVEGSAVDLRLGIDAADKLLAGRTALELNLSRDAAGTLRFSDARLANDQASAELAGAFGPEDGRLDLDARLNDIGLLAPDLSGPATLDGVISRSGDEVGIDADFSAPGDTGGSVDAVLTLRGDAADTLAGTVSGTASVRIGDLAPYAGLAGRPLKGALSADLKVSGDLPALTGRLEMTGTGRDLAIGIAPVDKLLAGRAELTIAAARGADGMLQIDRASLASPQIALSLAGRIGPQDGRITFDAALDDIGIYTPQVSGAATLQGVLTRDGDQFALQAGFSGPGETGGSVDGSMSLAGGSPGRAALRTELSVASLAPWSGLAGRDLTGGLDLTLSAVGDIADLTGQASLKATGRDVTIGIDPVDLLLQGQSTLRLDVARGADGIVSFETASFASPQGSADLAGQIGPETGRVTFKAALTDLALYAPDVNGGAALNGTLTRAGEDLQLEAGFSGPGEADGSLRADLALVDMVPGAVTADADISIGSLAPYSGLAGQALRGGLEATLSASGDLSDLTGDLKVQATGRDLAVGVDMADRLLVGESRLDLDVRRDADGIITFRSAEFDAPRLDVDLSGRLGPSGGSARFDLRLADIGVFGTGITGPASASGSLSSDGAGWQVETRATGPGGLNARIDGTLSQDFARANLSIDGTGRLELANTFIDPNLLSGAARFDLALNGPLALSSLSGTVRSSGASVTIPALKLTLSGVEATLRLSGGAADIELSGAGSQGGRIEVSGRVGLEPPFDAALSIRVRDGGVVEPGLYETSVDGTITINGPLSGGARIAGTLNLGRVEIRIPSGSGLASGELPGQLQHVNQPPSVLRTRIRAGLLDAAGGNGAAGGARPYPLDITVNAPSQIFVRGRGLDAELGGSLRLTGTTANVVTAGRFDLIRGRLDILGERLVLDEGSIRLQGAFDPYIRLVATTVSGDITIRIVIEGFLSDPDLEVTSQPDLPEEEVLARLLFERGIENISALQAVQLAAAIRTLAGGGGEGIVGRLRDDFGLDDLDVTTTEDGTAAVQAGKYISDNIYTGVSVDSQGRSEVDLNLQVSPSVTARGSVSSDGETSLGIFFERDY